jgi:RNA polymerase sigma-70 factor (ECF subfamily)
MSTRMAVRADSWPGPGEPTVSRSGALASELFEQHSEMVLSVCRVLLLDRTEAEDAMQQTFFSAYRSILAGSEPQRPAAWLATIARNECLNRIRARTRESLAEPVSRETRGAPDALNSAIAREDLHTLGLTIRELPDQQRQALLLHEFHGLPYRDVAAAIGISESAIASLLFRARNRLRAALRRSYASVPIPALWNAIGHLLARGPATGTAMPVVAKLGTAAVAVSLTAGAAVVVDHDVRSHHGPPPPARRSASPATAAPPKAHVAVAHVAVAAYAPRVARPTAVRPSGRAHDRQELARAKAPHPTRPAGAAQAKHSSQASGTPVSAPHSGSSDTTTHAHGRSSAAPGRTRSGHGSWVGTEIGIRHGHGRALGRAIPSKTQAPAPAASSKPKPGKHASSLVSGSASSSGPATDANRAGTPGNGPPNDNPDASSEQHGNGVQGNASADQGNGNAHQGH